MRKPLAAALLLLFIAAVYNLQEGMLEGFASSASGEGADTISTGVLQASQTGGAVEAGDTTVVTVIDEVKPPASHGNEAAAAAAPGQADAAAAAEQAKEATPSTDPSTAPAAVQQAAAGVGTAGEDSMEGGAGSDASGEGSGMGSDEGSASGSVEETSADGSGSGSGSGRAPIAAPVEAAAAEEKGTDAAEQAAHEAAGSGSAASGAGSGIAAAELAEASADGSSSATQLSAPASTCSARFQRHHLGSYSVKGLQPLKVFVTDDDGCEAACCELPGCNIWLNRKQNPGCQLFKSDNAALEIVNHKYWGKPYTIGLPPEANVELNVGDSDFTIIRGFRLRAPTLKKVSGKISSAATCAAHCAAQAACKAFSTNEQGCWLHRASAGHRPHELNPLEFPSFFVGWKKAQLKLKPYRAQRWKPGQFVMQERYTWELSYERRHVAINYARTKWGIMVPQQERVRQLYAMMPSIAAWFRRHNIPFWLDAGTLLGAVRDQAIIPWDEDADLGTPSSSLAAIRAAAAKDAVAPDVLTLKLQSSWLPIKFINSTSGIYVDLFTFSEVNGRLGRLHRRVAKGERRGNRGLPSSQFFPLRDCKLGNETYPCPKDSEAFLTELYTADWTTPHKW